MKPSRYTQEQMEEFVKQGYWGRLSDLWVENARKYADRVAVADSKNQFTWSQAQQWFDRVALGFLELGLKKDDVIVVQLPNICELLLSYSALDRAGLLGLPVMMTMRHREMEEILTRSGAVGVMLLPDFHDFKYYEMIREIQERCPRLKHIFALGDDVPEGAISVKRIAESPLEEKYHADYLEKTKQGLFEIASLNVTSGTTGLPKILEYPHVWWTVGKTDIRRFKLTVEDVCASFAPVVGGPGVVVNRFAAPHVAARVVLSERFDPEEALKLIEREKVTVASGVPAQMAMMVKHPNFDKYDYSSLRAFFYAGSPCPYHLAEEVEKKMGCRIVSNFGAFDAGCISSTSIDDPTEVRRGSVGRPYPGHVIKLLDEKGKEIPPGQIGEIVMKGAIFSSGYYRDPEKTRELWGDGGWYHSGDLGKFDENGNLYVVGRSKDIIIRGGQNIYPLEVENILIAHPKVLQVAVVSMPDPVMGEKGCAYVIPKEGQSLSMDEMVNFLLEKKIAKFKIPERLEIVERFPMTESGKVIKKDLAAEVARKLKEEGKI